MASASVDRANIETTDLKFKNFATGCSVVAITSVLALIIIIGLNLCSNGALLSGTAFIGANIGVSTLLAVSVVSMLISSRLRKKHKMDNKVPVLLSNGANNRAYYSKILLELSKKIQNYKKQLSEVDYHDDKQAFEDLIKELEQKQAVLIIKINQSEVAFQELRDLERSISDSYREFDAMQPQLNNNGHHQEVFSIS